MDVAKTLMLLVLKLLILRYNGTPLCGFLHKECSPSSSSSDHPDFDIRTYESNLNTATSVVIDQAKRPKCYSMNNCYSNYHRVFEGTAPHTVYAVAVCRGDINDTRCLNCLQLLFHEQLSSSSTKFTCTAQNQTGGLIFYAECMFRYANQPILDVFEVMPIYKWSDSDKVDQMYPYMEAISFTTLKNLSSSLVKEAGAGDFHQKFASGKAITVGSSSSVYATVQCTPNLIENECWSCIDIALNNIAASSVGSQGFVLMPSCWLLYDSSRFYNDQAARLQPATPPSSSAVGARTAVIYAIVSAMVAAYFTFIFTFVCLRYRSPARGKQVCAILSSEDEDEYQVFEFPYDTIRSATEDFHHQLGQGGFGPVYKGKLPHGEEIAVKKLSQKSSQGDREFGNEVRLLSKIQHRNLVKLLGFSFQNKDRLLIYEYLPNRSLDFYLFDPIKRAALYWGKRYKIIQGIARGIMYLHEDSRIKIIHCDLKTSNILLDEEMDAKIADFGLAKLFEIDQSYKQTERFAGTYGYAAPEYAIEGMISTKSDVYSFGIMVLEIITGQRNSKFRSEEGSDSLISYVWRNWNENTPLDIVDQVLLTCSITQYEITRCIHIGLLCVQENAKERPTMTQVVAMLSNCFTELRGPSQPAFIATDSCSGPAAQFIQILELAEFEKSEEKTNEHSIVV